MLARSLFSNKNNAEKALFSSLFLWGDREKCIRFAGNHAHGAMPRSPKPAPRARSRRVDSGVIIVIFIWEGEGNIFDGRTYTTRICSCQGGPQRLSGGGCRPGANSRGGASRCLRCLCRCTCDTRRGGGRKKREGTGTEKRKVETATCRWMPRSPVPAVLPPKRTRRCWSRILRMCSWPLLMMQSAGREYIIPHVSTAAGTSTARYREATGAALPHPPPPCWVGLGVTHFVLRLIRLP